MAILLGGRCWGKCKPKLGLNLNSLCLNLCLYHKNISFLCYQQFEFFFSAKFFFNNDSLISNILMLICLSQLLKKRPKVLIRTITNYGIDNNFLITLGEKDEWTKDKTAKKYFTKAITILRYISKIFGWPFLWDTYIYDR